MPKSKVRKKNDFTVLYSNLFDRRSVTTAMNHAAQRVAKATGAFVHHDMEYFSMVLNIDAHIRCSAFVCTHRSNFCRVIDELRALPPRDGTYLKTRFRGHLGFVVK